MSARAVAGLACAAAIAAVGAGVARAQPQSASTGYIGKQIPLLEIENCRPHEPDLTEEQLRARGSEHYQRGETLYVQGDYMGAVKEFVAAYCLIDFYTILKDIGQAYERDLQYEKAIAYLEAYVRKVPPDAKPRGACAADPQADKANVARRIEVLYRLRAHVLVETAPVAASITIRDETGVAAQASSGQPITIPGGKYEMIVTARDHRDHVEEIEVEIGKPFTYFIQLKPKTGRVEVHVSPPEARVYLRDRDGERFVGVGGVRDTFTAGRYTLIADAPGYVRAEQPFEVHADKVNTGQLELATRPQFGRRQLVGYSAAAGGLATAGLLFALDDTGVGSGLGFLAGAAGGLLVSYRFLPEQVGLGTSNLTITASGGALIAGLMTASLFEAGPRVALPAAGAGALLGGGAGYYFGSRRGISVGDAALINTGTVWGTTAGFLFASSFAPGDRIGAGITLSGLAMGAAGSIVMTRYYDISRTHAFLIDAGGLAGLIGGLALEGVVYDSASEGRGLTERSANFALGGMAVGLITAGLLARNFDTPSIPVQATFGRATDASGAATTTYGLATAW